jgi:hypothetical protein
MVRKPTGRRPGRALGHPKAGGRKKGTPNKATVERANAIAKAYSEARLTEADVSSITPLEALLLVMRRRLVAGDDVGVVAAATAAAPYCHARLVNSELRVRNEYHVLTDSELVAKRIELRKKLLASGRLIELEAEPER